MEIYAISEFDLQNAKVYKEHKNIDIFITDGTNHIILENKIYANEQKNQIARYIETIKKECECEFENITVLYLLLDKKLPSKYSIGDFEIENSFLVHGDERVKITAISYESEIACWLKRCKDEVGNITNLGFIIGEYENVIKKFIWKI